MTSQHRGASPESFGPSPATSSTGNAWTPSRRNVLRAGGVSAAGAALFGVASAEPAFADANSSAPLKEEFAEAAGKYDVPRDLLMAMGYVNTRLEMPAAQASDYERGEPHSPGTYGIMALVRNPSGDTLGRAARLTGFSEQQLKTDRAANIMGGAAVLADAQGNDRSRDPARWLGAVHGNGGRGERYTATAGTGSGELYAGQVDEALKHGFSVRVQSGEKVSLRGRKAQ